MRRKTLHPKSSTFFCIAWALCVACRWRGLIKHLWAVEVAALHCAAK